MTPPTAATHRHQRRPGRPKGGGVLADRAQLVAAAERAIAELGPDVTMDQIAAEAEVTKPILYRTIGDKAAVVEALSDVLVDRIGRALDVSVAERLDPRDFFTASIRAYLTAVDAHRDLYVFVNAAGQQTGLLRSRIDRSAQQLIDMFSATRGAVGSSTSPLTWSHSIVGALQTVTLMWIDDDPRSEHHDERTIDDLADDLTVLLWPGVAAVLGGATSTDPARAAHVVDSSVERDAAGGAVE